MLLDYWQALDRLVKDQAVRAPKGSPINNDTVAMEAGKSKGSIKKSRAVFSELIAAIESASRDRVIPSENTKMLKDKIKALRLEINTVKQSHAESLARELMLIQQIDNLNSQLSEISNISPIRTTSPFGSS